MQKPSVVIVADCDWYLSLGTALYLGALSSEGQSYE